MPSGSRTSSLRVAGLCGMVVAGLLLTGWGRERLHRLPRNVSARIQEVLMVPPGEVIRQLDLGYHSLAADLLFIRANLYYGQHILSDQQLPWLSHFIDILLEVDPDFKQAYMWSALATIYYRRQITRIPTGLVQRANRILEAGMNRFPGDYRFPMRIAWNLYYEMGDPDRAIPYFRRAANLPGSPPWLTETLVDLYTKRGQRELARRTLSELLLETGDPLLSRALKNRMAHLLKQSERQELTDLKNKLMEDWKNSYGYLPFDLYLLIREP